MEFVKQLLISSQVSIEEFDNNSTTFNKRRQTEPRNAKAASCDKIKRLLTNSIVHCYIGKEIELVRAIWAGKTTYLE